MHTAETRARDLQKRRDRRDKWLEDNGPCPCGSTENLEVDHIDPEEKVSHRVWSWSQQRRDAELAKCQVLCQFCHLKKTLAAYEGIVQHGTSTMYRNRGCRCEPCRDYKRSENKNRQRA